MPKPSKVVLGEPEQRGMTLVRKVYLEYPFRGRKRFLKFFISNRMAMSAELEEHYQRCVDKDIQAMEAKLGNIKLDDFNA